MLGGLGLSPIAGGAAPGTPCAGPAFSPPAALLRSLSSFPQWLCSVLILCWSGEGWSVGDSASQMDTSVSLLEE